MNQAGRGHVVGGPSSRAMRKFRTALRGACVAILAGMLVSCNEPSGSADSRRRATKDAEQRRNAAAEPKVDTTSLVTPTREDSLIGVARGGGGEATLKTECATCHEGAHAAPLGRSAAVSATCVDCHASSHAPVQAFYAGVVHGISIAPDTMFVARVSCVGCHSDTTFAVPAGSQRQSAYDGMCTSCHGRRFAGMLARWRGGVEWRAQAVAAYVGKAAADPRLAGDAARARVRGARQSLELLRTAGALHNVRGADQLFRAALDSTAAAYTRAGVAAPPRPAIGPGYAGNACMSCHYGVESARATVFGQVFDHNSHLLRADLACKECHSDASYFQGGGRSVPNEDRDLNPKHGTTRLTAASCESCHHSPTTKVACTSCHTGDEHLKRAIRVTMALKLRPEKAPKSRVVGFQHVQHEKTECETCHTTPGSVRSVPTCASCHTDHHKEKASGCVSCHGSGMLATHTMDTHYKCASCHERETVAKLLPDRAFCLSCHVKQATHEPGRECAPCHLRLSPTDVRRRMLAAPAVSQPRR